MGVGGWSPDGRFLLAGAWTTVLAFEKRQIIVDTTTGEYAVLGKLGEGDYGCEFAWVSVNLLERSRYPISGVFETERLPRSSPTSIVSSVYGFDSASTSYLRARQGCCTCFLR